jgi:hypothetical protein
LRKDTFLIVHNSKVHKHVQPHIHSLKERTMQQAGTISFELNKRENDLAEKISARSVNSKLEYII